LNGGVKRVILREVVAKPKAERAEERRGLRGEKGWRISDGVH